MLENKSLIEPIDTPQLSNQNLSLFVLVIAYVIGGNINFFPKKGIISYLSCKGTFDSSSSIDFHNC